MNKRFVEMLLKINFFVKNRLQEEKNPLIRFFLNHFTYLILILSIFCFLMLIPYFFNLLGLLNDLLDLDHFFWEISLFLGIFWKDEIIVFLKQKV